MVISVDSVIVSTDEVFLMSDHNFPKTRMSARALGVHQAGFVRSLSSSRPETRGTYERALRGFIRWFPQDGNFRFQIEDVERYKRHLTSKKKLSKVSVSTYLTALRRFCEYLVKNMVLKANPARFVDGNKRPLVHSRGTLRPDEVQTLFGAIDDDGKLGVRDYAMAKLMLGCGLSEIEIIRANIGDITVMSGTASLIVQGKGRRRKDERVVLPEDVKNAIDRYLAQRSRKANTEPLFVSAGNRTQGLRLSTRGVRDRINYYLHKAGLRQGKRRRITPYSLRHTAAIMMADAGANADEIRRRMRLGTIATAMLYLDRPTNPIGKEKTKP